MSASRMRDNSSRAACSPPSPPDLCCAARRAARLGAALVLALSLLPTVPAQAQDKVEVWSATLDVADLPAFEAVGCSDFFLPVGGQRSRTVNVGGSPCVSHMSAVGRRQTGTERLEQAVDAYRRAECPGARACRRDRLSDEPGPPQ